MALQVRRRRVGSGDRAVEIVDVIGRLDAPGAALLRSSVQEALKEGSPKVAINLTECVEIHREMVGTLHSLGRACIRAGGTLVIFGATGDVHEYLRTFADRNLAAWFESENDAILALGGETEPEKETEEGEEPSVVVALGSSDIFRKLFWKLSALGGRPVAKFDNIDSAYDYLKRRDIHSLVMDVELPIYDAARLVRQIRTTPQIRSIGVIAVGPSSRRNAGRTLLGEGADHFVPYVFTGEEILAKLDGRAFFSRLKEAYSRFETPQEPDED